MTLRFITIGRRQRVASTAALALVLVLATGCDQDPGFTSSQSDPSLTTIIHDNPTVAGTKVVWSESWMYYDANPLDGTRPASSKQTVWADSGAPLNTSQAVSELTASHAIFAGGMTQSTSPFTFPAGSASTVFKTSVSTNGVPWIYMPPLCGRMEDPDCLQYWHRPSPNQAKPYTFPFIAGNLNLPSNTNVTINLVNRMHNPNTGGIWGTSTTVLRSATLRTDPNLVVAPVHVHVFTDTSGRTNHKFMGGLTGDSGRAAYAAKLRKVFDDYAVSVVGPSTAASNNSWHREYTSQMTRNILDTEPGNANLRVFDQMIDNCKVQVRLASVDFIKQSAGLEKATIGFANANSMLPFWTQDNPTMATAAAKMAQHISAVGSVHGAHVFIVGSINPGQFSGFDFKGIGFWKHDSFSTPGYALVSGSQSGAVSDAGGTMALQHEVGHVLGLEHGSSPDEINLMLGSALTTTLCDRLHSRSANLQ